MQWEARHLILMSVAFTFTRPLPRAFYHLARRWSAFGIEEIVNLFVVQTKLMNSAPRVHIVNGHMQSTWLWGLPPLEGTKRNPSEGSAHVEIRQSHCL